MAKFDGLISSSFLLGAASGALILTSVFLLLETKSTSKVQFDEINVGRINIVEPDGSTRLIISNRALFPGDFTKGRVESRPDRPDFAGILFIDEEGAQNGRQIQKGSIDKDNKIDAENSLTFERFRQDQRLHLLLTDVYY